MAKTIVGLFDSFNEAQNVVQELVNSGFARERISLVANDARGEYGNVLRSREVGETSVAEGAGAGAVGGGVLGGVLGLLVGLGALAIPGVGPIIAAGPLAAALGTVGASTVVGAGIGAVSGGLLGALVGAGIPEEDAHYYAEGVRRGGTLVMVTADDATANTAYSILERRGAVDIRTRGAQWRQSGWERFDPNAGPYMGTGESFGEEWRESSKVGTAAGTAAGAATGAVIGSAVGPIGTVAGGVAGAAAGAGLGAAGDVAGEKAEDKLAGDDEDNTTRRSRF